uniref:Uncharacterized protein n=1 Tax=Anguilla anguilla TaxID=7936 RepID=A0A0E9PZE4_ANGAN
MILWYKWKITVSMVTHFSLNACNISN